MSTTNASLPAGPQPSAPPPSGAPSPTAAQPPQAQHAPAAPSRSVEEIAADLEARRRALASDVDEVAARLAPASLKRMAQETADAAAASLRSRTQALRERAEELTSQAGLTSPPHSASVYGGDPGTPPLTEAAPGATEPLTLSQRLTRLLDDARDGDPVSLAVVTAAGLTVAGLGILTLTRVIRS
ncbi:DUF3618 domain-containing protein [Actinomyces sp. 2119]|uniref:DUF3618 domain-containing protein n=1 Tax=Actinomyces sp. 2119 TaxID=2321393 RepID=UPI000E6C36B8|nr:DUF3618 domain-containing protein [Actinomyces sp. 2119]RJF41920.1 DUF3618 domain-containing protein [Actinomyces sp. 2119]